MAYSIKIEGFAELRKKVDALGKKARGACVKSVREGSKPILKAMKDYCPRDEGITARKMTREISTKRGNVRAVIGADVAKLKDDEKRPSNIDHLLNDGHTAPDGTIIPPTRFRERAADASLPTAETITLARLKSEIENAAR